MAESRLLPLFPLGTVLFPGVVLPLHVFEERYKTMIQRCLAADGLLGIVLIRQGWEVGAPAEPFDVGTLARIARTDAVSDGKLNVAIVGQKRIRIVTLVDGEPYRRADCEILADEVLSVPPGLIDEVRHQFVDYVHTLRRLSNRAEGNVRLPDGVLELSYAVAANLQIPRTEQQALLEDALSERLRHESNVLRREMALLQRLGPVSTRRARAPTDVPLN